MTLIAEKSIQIVAPPEVIWRVLTDLPAWKSWWPDCYFAQNQTRGQFGEGSQVELVVRPGRLKHTFRPLVDLYTERKTLSFTQRSFGVQATVTWQLQPLTDQTRVSVRGVFQGPLIFIMRVFQRGDLAQISLASQLRGLKKVAERLAAG